MQVFRRVFTPPPKRRAPCTGVPGVVVQPRPEDTLVEVPGFVALVAVARRGALIGWVWVRRAVGTESVQEARYRGVEFAEFANYAPGAQPQ